MKKIAAITVVTIASLFIWTPLASAQSAPPRQKVSLDGASWRVWLDEQAEWATDKLYAPGEIPALNQLPVNAPTSGWDSLATQGIACTLPACVEQLFSKGDPAYQYHGVSWFSASVKIPADWQGKCVRLDIARAHLRVEVYVNRKLAGYDLCMESPCGFDLTPYMKAGEPNELAIRITNPGGSRGYNDTQLTRWGIPNKPTRKKDQQPPSNSDRLLPSGRDFGGLDTLTLTATDPVYIADIFVMNQLPACSRNLEIRATLRNTTTVSVKRTFCVKVADQEKRVELNLQPGENSAVIPLTVPGAKLWSPDTPNLYTCEAFLSEINSAKSAAKTAHETDRLSTRFGFRTIEVKEDASGKSCFYLNGVRFRHRSAIDFGFYSHTGLAATKEQAERSVRTAKEIGHNGINLHRHIGEYRMLNAADEIGLTLYGEPGGMHQWQGEFLAQGTLAEKVMQEKIRRMALRDRNHPSLLMYNLSNEDNYWGPERETALKEINKINPAVFVSNASGHVGSEGRPPPGGAKKYRHAQPSGPNCHIRPYETAIRNDFEDDHTVGSTARFDEFVFSSHMKDAGKNLFYYGEVFCHTGPANWWMIARQTNESAGSYDLLSSQENHDEIDKAFTEWSLASTGSKLIRSPADISRQAGRGLMYMNSRLSQRIMSNNSVDGYAINGWSAHSYCTPADTTPNDDAWDSALVDAGRNLKGPAEDYRYWMNPAQVALFRKSVTSGQETKVENKAKYVKPGDIAGFEVCLINEGKIPAGVCKLRFTVTDGAGKLTAFKEERPLPVTGGDTYAQPCGELQVPVQSTWHAGHLTLHAELLDAAGKTVATGTEQMLLQNRASFAADLADIKIAVDNWPAAETALKNAEAKISNVDKADIILAATAPENAGLPTDQLLTRVRAGATLILKFDAAWAEILHKEGILSQPVTEWGGEQISHWFGNGWGYLDHFVGNQNMPSKTTIATTGWEVPDNPVGFYPFASTNKLSAYGLYMARKIMPTTAFGRTKIQELPTLLVLLGTIDYGKGKIILAPSYPVDRNTAFNDLLFFNMITKAAKKEW